MDIAQGTNKEYKVTVEWKYDTKKQLQVTREDITDGSKKITIFQLMPNTYKLVYSLSIFSSGVSVTSSLLGTTLVSKVCVFNGCCRSLAADDDNGENGCCV